MKAPNLYSPVAAAAVFAVIISELMMQNFKFKLFRTKRCRNEMRTLSKLINQRRLQADKLSNCMNVFTHADDKVFKIDEERWFNYVFKVFINIKKLLALVTNDLKM